MSVCVHAVCACCVCSYLLSQQHRGVAVLAVGLRAQCGEAQEEEEQSEGPDHQLPVQHRVQERLVAVQQLQYGKIRSHMMSLPSNKL